MTLEKSSGFNVETRFAMLLRGWVALDPKSGAFLSMSRGRTKSGQGTRYVLVLPNKTVEERGGLFTHYEWEYPAGRKFITAYSGEEAIKKANKLLHKMLQP